MHAYHTLETGHVGLNVSDIQRSKKFYQEVFGFQLLKESLQTGREWAFLSNGDKLPITLWQQSKGSFEKQRPGLHHLSFQAPDMDAVKVFENKLKALKVPFLYDGVVPHSEGAQSGGIFFEDPDGIRLEIYAPSGAQGCQAPSPGAPSCGFF
ncbi:MAG TPA: VOC family protein [Gammaproteobacteria bacterium]|nr:VOC family protein [Gammaproteobacteria bacterium]